MAIQLRANEKIEAEAHFHWISYLLPGIWAGLFGLSLLGQILMLFFPKADSSPVGSAMFFTIVFGFGPLTYVWLKNKTKCYVVTNQRLYIENGIISKTKIDVPLSKINDISFSQSLLQRIFKTGNILIMTGNDKTNVLKDIDQPEQFREVISQLCNNKVA